MIQKQLAGATITLALSMYAYHTQWLLVPMMMVMAGYHYFGKNCWKFWLGGAIMFLPLIIDFGLNAGPGARANSEMIWSGKNASWWWQFPGNFLANYWSYINPTGMFFNGLGLLKPGNPFEAGLLLWPMFWPLIMRIKTNKNKFLLLWLIVSPVVPALTRENYNIVRSLNMVVPLVVFIAMGIHKMSRWWWLLTMTVLINFSLIYFWHFPKENAESFQGYRPVAIYLKTIEDRAEEIWVEDKYGNFRWGLGKEYIGVPHLYLGYFNYWDPEVLQKRKYREDGVYFGKYVIRKIDWGSDIFKKDRFYVVSAGNPPEDIVKVKLKEEAVFYDAAGMRSFEVWSGR